MLKSIFFNVFRLSKSSLPSHRSVSTGLASTFNKIHYNASLKRESYFEKTGLFGIDELRTPEGFHSLRENAIKDANQLVEKIVSLPEQSIHVLPLFDELSNTLCKVADLAEFVRNGHTQPRFKSTAEQTSIAISSLVEQLNTNLALYSALKNAKPNDELDDRVIKLFMFDFEQSGIHLSADKRNQILNLNENILRLGSIFAANSNLGRTVRKSQIPEALQSNFSFVSDEACINSLCADSDNEKLRELSYKLFLSYDETQDSILSELLSSRLKLAQLCGFESYAHRAVKGSIAGEPELVKSFLDILNDRLKGAVKKDFDHLLQIKLKSNPIAGKTLNAWDVPYLSNLYKRSIYNENVVQCLPYFSVGSCMDGLNMIFNELYGVSMQVDTCTTGELWHNDVIKLRIVENESSSALGYIYCDLFERATKQHQDCHHTIRGGCLLRNGSYQKPIVVLVLSLPDSDNNPSLLSPMMVDNLFHEMGHAMHSMMARTKYQHITGTRCSTDLAEVPSILMEFFASDARVLSRFARHHESGEPMPDELIKYWIKSKRIFTASETQLQVFYAALDQAYHSSEVGLQPTSETLAQIQANYYPIPLVQGTAWQLRFAHLIGYGAKYYSYLVSRAVAAAIWRKLFADNPLSRPAGLRYKHKVLAHGGGKPARKIAEDVLGESIDADFIAKSVAESIYC